MLPERILKVNGKGEGKYNYLVYNKLLLIEGLG